MDICLFEQNKLPEFVTELSSLPRESFIWIDCHIAEIDTAFNYLDQFENIKVHERHKMDCKNPLHPCSFESMEDYDILIFRSLISSFDDQELIQTQPIKFIIGENILISIHEGDVAIQKVKSRMKTLRAKVSIDKEALLCQILNQIVDTFLILREGLQSQTDRWEGVLLHGDHSNVTWSEFLDFKSNVRLLRNLSEEQGDVVILWRDDINLSEHLYMTEHLKVLINDLLEHIRRIERHTKQVEGDIESLIQLHYLVIGHRTNEIVRVLTVISCIFLPLTLITGIFGMNFVYMDFLKSPHGYTLTMAFMLLLVLVLLGIFRWRKWI